MEGALSRQLRLISDYESEGFIVTNARAQKDHYVYVIELHEPRLGGEGSISKTYYVGQSGLKPDDRFNAHLEGRNSNSYVERYGKNLRPDLVPDEGPMTYLDSLRLERQLANDLRTSGLYVRGGH
jgi:hypothetical protein